jgi:alkyl hydroperoxide reductase subunit AhpF
MVLINENFKTQVLTTLKHENLIISVRMKEGSQAGSKQSHFTENYSS